MDDGNYTGATIAFVNWLEANGTTVSEKIDLIDMRNQDSGRGVGTIHITVKKKQRQH